MDWSDGYIIIGRQLHNIPEELKKDHDLLRLWGECRTLLERTWPNDSKQDLVKVENSIKQFHDLDPTSYSFRYPINNKGEETIPDETHIHLGQLSKSMNEIAELLDGARLGINDKMGN